MSASHQSCSSCLNGVVSCLRFLNAVIYKFNWEYVVEKGKRMEERDGRICGGRVKEWKEGQRDEE